MNKAASAARRPLCHIRPASMKKQPYESPVIEVLTITQEERFLQSGGNGTSEPIGYDDDPFGGGN